MSVANSWRFQDFPIQVDWTFSWVPEIAAQRCGKYSRRVNRISMKGSLEPRTFIHVAIEAFRNVTLTIQQHLAHRNTTRYNGN